MKHKVTVTAMPVPEPCGDWHDQPSRWIVCGPGDEVQKFSTKAWALKYATFRRNSETAAEAGVKFACWS